MPDASQVTRFPFTADHRNGEWKSYEDIVQEHHPLDPSSDVAGDKYFNGVATIAQDARSDPWRFWGTHDMGCRNGLQA